MSYFPLLNLEYVAEAIQEVAEEQVTRRFSELGANDVEEKAQGELVTTADRECEAALAIRLRSVLRLPVVGEESSVQQPDLLDVLGTGASSWIVDPIDGTSNFAAGNPDYAVMVAYVHNGTLAASWIWIPSKHLIYIAEDRNGATRNGEPLDHPKHPADTHAMTGIIKERFLPDAARSHLAARRSEIGSTVADSNCAGIEYSQIAEGAIDYILYWRTLPWDHAPGVLLARETGHVAVRVDGSEYTPSSNRAGLLIAPSDSSDDVCSALGLAALTHIE
ncbi:MAG: inositol monophosphatase [bacterium]|nr:inositol monophosphatase [bacterium]